MINADPTAVQAKWTEMRINAKHTEISWIRFESSDPPPPKKKNSEEDK